MKRKWSSAALVATVAAGLSMSTVETASAIPPGNRFGPGGTAAPMVRPAVSPYLALAPGGLNRSLATTYFTFVRPQIFQGQAIQQQGAAISQIQQQLRIGSTPIYGQTGYGSTGTQPVRSTGYQSWYMQHRSYYGVGFRLAR